MTHSWSKHICQNSFSPSALNVISACENDVSIGSAIDQFYVSMSDYIKMLSQNNVANDKAICALILVGMVSTTENYIRTLFSSIYASCPNIRKKSYDEAQIMLSSIMWHGLNDAGKSILEGKSLACKKELKKFFSKYIGLDIEKCIDERTLEDFEKICHMRHCIVHSGNYLAGNNAIILSVEKQAEQCRLKIDKNFLHDASGTLTSLIVTLNGAIFDRLVNEWAIEWPKDDNWTKESARKIFKEIWNCFYSEKDAENGNIPEKLSLIKCRNQIEKAYI